MKRIIGTIAVFMIAAGCVSYAQDKVKDTMGAPCPKDGKVLLGKDGKTDEWTSERKPGNAGPGPGSARYSPKRQTAAY